MTEKLAGSFGLEGGDEQLIPSLETSSIWVCVGICPVLIFLSVT